MRKLLLAAAMLLAGSGCGGAVNRTVRAGAHESAGPAIVAEDATLGRVVVYRSGVAYFERYAKVDGDTLTLRVAPDKLDDFLKSLTIVDLATGQAVPVEYPTTGGADKAQGGLVEVVFPLRGKAPHRLRLSYVTESPAWKPSYRVALGKDGEIDLQGWAVVDNTSGEDWRDVRLGVGASSSLSFRYDMRRVKTVQRDPLRASEIFAGAVSDDPADAPPPPGNPAAARGAPSTEPIGTSSFESSVPMTIPRGSSAMVSVLHERTQGEIVYLYDLDSTRPDAAFPARAVRMKNPTSSALESGPVSLFGDGRYLGEGLSEPIPGSSTAFIPFALDRQVVAEGARASDTEKITRLASVQGGVFQAELLHAHHRAFSLRNRFSDRAVVYVRHTVAPGYTLADATPSNERLGDAQLFRVLVDAHKSTEVAIDEETHVARNLDIRAASDLALLEAYLPDATLDAGVKERALALIAVQKQVTSDEARAAALDGEIDDLTNRQDNLKEQVAELKRMGAAPSIVRELAKKVEGLTDRAAKAKAERATVNERLTLARVDFEEGAADLTADAVAPANGAQASR